MEQGILFGSSFQVQLFIEENENLMNVMTLLQLCHQITCPEPLLYFLECFGFFFPMVNSLIIFINFWLLRFTLSGQKYLFSILSFINSQKMSG